jgi:branched-chain amino acid transport system ATP-binding protein
MSAVLEVSNLRKSFGGITAVNDVSFVREGEIPDHRASGRGKSTLFNCVLAVISTPVRCASMASRHRDAPCDLNRPASADVSAARTSAFRARQSHPRRTGTRGSMLSRLFSQSDAGLETHRR